MKRSFLVKLSAGLVFVGALASFQYWAPAVGLPAELPDSATLRRWVEGLGGWGPVAVIGLMMLAILVSPIPSAPIALAAGAIYGHIWGTLYVLTGAEIGALCAFGIARLLGHEVIHRWFGATLTTGLLGSQNVLMGTVFVSRLLPFISFDVVSYAAGLTALSFWRFAIATLAGIVPASFLLAHLGSEMVAGETDRILWAVVLIGAVTAVPVIAALIAGFRRRRQHPPAGR